MCFKKPEYEGILKRHAELASFLTGSESQQSVGNMFYVVNWLWPLKVIINKLIELCQMIFLTFIYFRSK